MKSRLAFLAATLVLFSCGPRRSNVPAPPGRDFPQAEIPLMITEPSERMEWLAEHFWDRFAATDSLYLCDSLHINGVAKEKVEAQVGIFTTLLMQQPSLEAAQKAVASCFLRLEALQLARPEGNVLPEVSALLARYLYDPNSPVRSEDLYLPYVSRLAESPATDPVMKPAYAWDARMCSLNRAGTVAADFTFVDTAGKRRTLHGIQAPYTLLIFGNPDCHACKELMIDMSATPSVQDLMDSGRLKVVDIYIDEDIALWKERMQDYPQDWINGYDPSFTIRTDLIYNVRALPSLYLLDKDKKVMLKDAPQETVMMALQSL